MSEMMIGSAAVRRDEAGRFCLNDLHRASGGERRHQPGEWIRLGQTEDLAEELAKSADPRSYPIDTRVGRGGGTYVARELVYAYAMWISAAFHLQVIRAHDQLQAAPAGPSPLVALDDPATLRGLLLTYTERVESLQARVHHQEPQVRALQQLAGADGAFSITTAAKMLQIKPRQLFAWLEQNGWIYRRAGSRNWLAYQPRLNTGVLSHKAIVTGGSDDVQRVHEQVLVTAKGLTRLGELINREQLGWTPADHTRAQQLAVPA